ncbi:calcium-binding protein [Novosphingobium sp.]|uniref:calcium-binding protein n=1 Tax=Novosphingobium sp. TaxID=1874826 RepID=UPI00262042AF|nr:calcium-binding protein [Novosphingobium sp.]
MAVATTTAGLGDTWSNVFSDETLRNFQFGQTLPPTLSSNGLEVTYTFGPDVVKLVSDLGFFGTPSNTFINGFLSGDTTMSGFALRTDIFLTHVLNGDNDALNLTLWAGSDRITGGASDDTIRGYSGNDILRGNDGNDTLIGDNGNDWLFGGNGNDSLRGGAGSDQLDGGLNNDQLSGGAGDDLLIGGLGLDNMLGGTGADTFRFMTASDFVVAGPNPFAGEWIRDFNRAEGDKIDLNRVDAANTLAGNQDFVFIGTDVFGTNTPGQVRVVSLGSPSLWQVQLNTDNDTGAEFAIVVISYSNQPVAADFLL